MSESDQQELRTRLNKWLFLVLGTFGLLLLRFLVLQVVQNAIWRDIADNHMIRELKTPSMRGNIYDRNHRLLADWRQSFNVTVIPRDFTDPARTRLAAILTVAPEEIKARMEKNRSWSPFIPVLVAEDIPWEQFAQVEEDRLVMPGVDTEVRPVRQYYPDSVLVSHLLGYLGEITREEMQDPEYRDYRMGDRIGRSGLERALEEKIRGVEGLTYKLVDAVGREITLDSIPLDLQGRMDYRDKLESLEKMSRKVEPGQSVVLTIDLKLQQIARDDFGDNDGAVVVMDVKTGELLAFYSSPGYEPSLFERKISPEVWSQLSDSPRKPLLNRAVQGLYPPGSIFKIVVAAAGLEEGVITPGTTFYCDGTYELHHQKFRCWNHQGHGTLPLELAIMESCDVFFYNLGERLGVQRIATWARKFGIGRPVGEGLLEEKSGLVPDPAWKLAAKRRKWVPGDTINFAIGQGYLLITPLQAVLIPAAVANGGRLMRPQLIHHFEDVHGNKSQYQPRVINDHFLRPETLRLLRRGMERVVGDGAGTAYKYVHSEFINIAGKTGTSEVSKKYQGRSSDDVPREYRDHAWFVAYTPAENPELALVVMVEHGGGGGAVAGSIAKKIIEDYYIFRAARRDPGLGGG